MTNSEIYASLLAKFSDFNKKISSPSILYPSKLEAPLYFRIVPITDTLNLPFIMVSKYFIRTGGRVYNLISFNSFDMPCVIKQELETLKRDYKDNNSVIELIDTLRPSFEFFLQIAEYKDSNYSEFKGLKILSLNSKICTTIMAYLTDVDQPSVLHDIKTGRMLIMKTLGDGKNKQYLVNTSQTSKDITNDLSDTIVLESTVKSWVKHPEYQRAVVRSLILNEPISPEIQKLKYEFPSKSDPDINIIRENNNFLSMDDNQTNSDAFEDILSKI